MQAVAAAISGLHGTFVIESAQSCPQLLACVQASSVDRLQMAVHGELPASFADAPFGVLAEGVGEAALPVGAGAGLAGEVAGRFSL